MKITQLSAIGLLATATGLLAQTTYQVDFGISSQETSTTGWNNMGDSTPGNNPGNLTGIVDSVGNTTGVSITYSEIGTAGVSGSGANYTGSYPAALSSLPASALQDGLFFQQGPLPADPPASITLTISGLNDSLTYNFILYGARGNNGSADTTFSVTGSNTSGVINVGPMLNNNDDFASITGISPSVGVITVTGTTIGGASNNGGALNVMVMTEIVPPDDDNDGIPNAYEIANGTDPNEDGTLGETSSGAKDGPNGAAGDKDADGLTNIQEYKGWDATDTPTGFGQTLSGTADSDEDDVNDGDEVSGALNPWDEFGFPDGPPGLPSNPNDSDSDDDTLSDGDEILVHGSDPNWGDTDVDTLPDAYEVANGLDPTIGTGDDGATGDKDMDDLTNAQELSIGTNPTNDDTDDDTLKDGDEVLTYFSNPFVKDTDGDLIEDGAEVAGTTSPILGDSDDDGIKDYIEIEAGSDPDDIGSLPTFPAIAWTVKELSSASVLDTSGTLLYAENFHGPETVANGITFAATEDDRSNGDYGKSSLKVQTLLNAHAVDTAIYDEQDPTLSPLLETVWYQSGNPNANNIGLTGLTPGKTYRVEFGLADDRSAASYIGRWRFVDGVGGNTPADPVGPTNTFYGGPTNPAILFSGTFTATSTVQGFATGQNSSGDVYLGSQLSFIQVREVPATSTISISSAAFNGANFEVTATGLDTGTQYRLMRSANLADGFPTVVDGPRTPATATEVFIDTAPPAGKAFYRLEDVPVP